MSILKKIIAPVIVTLIIGICILGYTYGIFAALKLSEVPAWIVILILIGFLTLLCALIYTLYKRIKEIKEENEDDISKY